MPGGGQPTVPVLGATPRLSIRYDAQHRARRRAARGVRPGRAGACAAEAARRAALRQRHILAAERCAPGPQVAARAELAARVQLLQPAWPLQACPHMLLMPNTAASLLHQ